MEGKNQINVFVFKNKFRKCSQNTYNFLEAILLVNLAAFHGDKGHHISYINRPFYLLDQTKHLRKRQFHCCDN